MQMPSVQNVSARPVSSTQSESVTHSGVQTSSTPPATSALLGQRHPGAQSEELSHSSKKPGSSLEHAAHPRSAMGSRNRTNTRFSGLVS